MKILVVHNAYRERGGEDAVVEAETALLRRHGHEVLEYRRDNREIDAMAALPLAAQTIWSRRTLRELGALFARQRPEVVHLHNSFPLISPSVCAAAARAGVPLVQTLHNYRLACPQAMFLRDGRPCEDCLGRAPWPAVRHACYRGSRAQTLVLVTMQQVHRGLNTWQRHVARWIALSAFSRGKFIAAGLPAERIAVLPNFAEAPDAPAAPGRSGLLFVGRLSREKGLAVMAEALRLAPDLTVDVIGDGPDAALLSATPHARCLGAQPPARVMLAMQQAQALVLPSLVYENSPRVLIEAAAAGLPVVASRLGAMAELVEAGRNGWLVPAGDASALAATMREALADPAEASRRGREARAGYEARHTPAAHHDALLALYRTVIAEQPAAQGRSR